jgi:hypothetical protein
MKRNLNRIFEAWNPSSLPSSPIHMQALFVLAWFHAVVQVCIILFDFKLALSGIQLIF